VLCKHRVVLIALRSAEKVVAATAPSTKNL